MKKALALVLPAAVLGVVLGVFAVGGGQWLGWGYGPFLPSIVVAAVLLVTSVAALLLGALRWLWPLCTGLLVQLLGLLLLYRESWGFNTPWKPVWWTLVAIAFVLGVMGAVWLVVTVRTRWFERKMLQGVGDAGAEELETIRKAFQDALAKLRRAGRGRNAIYELPWFLVLGRPQGGKTTAIKNSGLGLPVRKDWVKGVGGTVNVDFFFTNDLIFMDTPGRWVTDGANEREQQQWVELLRLLRKFRGHRPLDGLVVAVPVDDLLSLSEDALRDQASRVREILDLLHGELRFRFPVYLIVTKCDLVDGFVEFFRGLPVQRRHEILGWSNPDPNRGTPARLLAAALPRMLRRLEAYRLEMLARIASSGRARKLFFFPEEFRRLAAPLQVYADELFHRDGYRETPVFRGLFFTSGTQGEGSPIGQALADFARNLGVRVPPAAPEEEEEQKRSYFLLQLFRDLMVQDEGLVGRTAGQWWARRRNTLFGALLPALASVCFVAIAGISFGLNRAAWARVGRDVPRVVAELQTELPISEVLSKTEELRLLHDDAMGSLLRSFGMRRGGELENYSFQAFRTQFESRLLVPTLGASQDFLAGNEGDCAAKIDVLHAVVWLRSAYRVDLGDTAGLERLWGMGTDEERTLLGRQFRHLDRYVDDEGRHNLLPGFDLERAARAVRQSCDEGSARSTLERYLMLERQCVNAGSNAEVESCYTSLLALLSETPQDYAARQSDFERLRTDVSELRDEGQVGASGAVEVLQSMRLSDRETNACLTRFDKEIRPALYDYVNRRDLLDACRMQVKGTQNQVDREEAFSGVWNENGADIQARGDELKEALKTFEKTCPNAVPSFHAFNLAVLRDATKGGIRVICVEPEQTVREMVVKAKTRAIRDGGGGGGGPALVQLKYLEHLQVPDRYRPESWQEKKESWGRQLALKSNYSAKQYLEVKREVESGVEDFSQQYVAFWKKYLREIRLRPRPSTVSVPDWVQGLATTSEFKQVLDDAVSALTTIHETERPFNFIDAQLSEFAQFAQYQGEVASYQRVLQQVAQDLKQIAGNDKEWRRYKRDLTSKPLGTALTTVASFGGPDRLPVKVLKDPLLEAQDFVNGKESSRQDWPELVALARRVRDGYPLTLDGDPAPLPELVRLLGDSGLVRRVLEAGEAEPASDAAGWLARANDVSGLLFDENDAPRPLRVQWVKEPESFEKPDLAEKIEVRKIHLKLGEGIEWSPEPGKKDNKTLRVPVLGDDAPKDSELSVTLAIRKKFGKVLPGSNWKEQTDTKPASGPGAPWKLIVQGLPQPAGLDAYQNGAPQLEYSFPIKDGDKTLGHLKLRFRLEGEDVPRFLQLLKQGLPQPPATAL